MTEKACYWTISPEPDTITERVEGTSFDVMLGLKNCGDKEGNFFCVIANMEGHIYASLENKVLTPGRTAPFIFGTVVQPSEDVKLLFIGGHAEGGEWVRDFAEVATLRPKVSEVKCTQKITIVDEEGHGIPYVEIKITNDKTVTKTTDSFGRLSIELTEGVRYSFEISKAGYQTVSDSVPACLDMRHVLKGISEDTCAQTVQVHKKGSISVIRGVQIEARPRTGNVIRCTTDSNGRCTLKLIENEVYDISISPIPSGYECQYDHDCEKRNVMACSTEIEFYLKGEGEPGPPSGERWKHIDSGTWNNGMIEFKCEMENPLTEKLDSGECRYRYKGFAQWGTKTAESSGMSVCGALTSRITLFSLSPGDKVDIQLDRFDELEDVWLKSIDRETVTIPEKEEVNKITITVGSTFDAAAIVERKLYCGEVVPLLTSWMPKPIGYDVCKKDIPATRIVEFTAADGLVVGHHYVFTIYPIIWLDQVLNGNVFEFKGTKAWTIQAITFIHKPICNFLDIPPESQACKDEVAEFIDVVYAYNTIQKIVNHTDMHGNPAEPETLDYVMLPLVVAASFLPLPVGKAGKLLSKMSGRLSKLANTAAKKTFLLRNQKRIHQLAAVGDDVNLRTFWDNFELGKLTTCETILKQAAEVAGKTEVGRASMRTNMGKWIKGIRNKWKKDPGIKTKLDDLEKGADGNLFKSFESTISSHFDDAVKAGDWKKASQIWHGGAMDIDGLLHFEKNLATYTPEFQAMHNILRYSTPDFIGALKDAKRFDLGTQFLHGTYTSSGEVVKKGFLTKTPSYYTNTLKGLDDAEVARIAKNLADAGKDGLSRQITFLKGVSKSQAAKKGVTEATELADEAAKGATKKNAGGVLDSYIEMLEKIKASVGEEAARDATKKTVVDMTRALGIEAGTAPISRKEFLKWFLGKRNPILSSTMSRSLLVAHGIFKVSVAYFLFTMVMDISIWALGTCFHYWPKDRVNVVQKQHNDIEAKIYALDKKVEEARRLATANRPEDALAIFAKIKNSYYPEVKKMLGGPDTLDTQCPDAYRDINKCPESIYKCSSLYWKIKCNEGELTFFYNTIGPFPMVGPLAYLGLDEIQREKLEGAYSDFMDAWGTLVRNMDDAVAELPATEAQLKSYMVRYGYEDSVAPAPASFYCLNPTKSSIELHWSPSVPHADYPCSIKYYEIAMGGIVIASVPHVAGQKSYNYIARNLKSNTEYFFQIQAVDAYGIYSTPRTDSERTKGICPLPTAYIKASNTSPRVGEEVSFDPSMSDPGKDASYKSLSWIFGDGETAHETTEKMLYHTYTKAGKYTVKLTVENDCGESRDTSEIINVGTEVGSITFKCAYNDDYCTRGATIEYRKEGATKWESFGEKTSSYPPIKKDLLAGVYEVKYNLLGVMGCEGKVTVKAGETVDFDEQMSLLLPTSINTTVKKIVDGDSIRTARTDSLPVPSAAYTHQEIRIIGYDAFECENYPTLCTPFGKYGGDKLKELIPVGSNITLKIDKWHPLGEYNRIIAVVHKGHVDIASEMLKSCLVIISEKKYQDKYSWINWVEYNRLWCDPTEVVASAGKHPTIVDVDTQKKSFRVKNPWLTLNIWAKFFPSDTSSVELLLESGKTSAPISYTLGTTAIQLFACLGNLKDKKKEWIEVDKWFVTPTKKVTFDSTPAGASVSITSI